MKNVRTTADPFELKGYGTLHFSTVYTRYVDGTCSELLKPQFVVRSYIESDGFVSNVDNKLSSILCLVL